VGCLTCPVSQISAASARWLHEFGVFRSLGGTTDWLDRPARRVDAFVLLSQELNEMEGNHDD